MFCKVCKLKIEAAHKDGDECVIALMAQIKKLAMVAYKAEIISIGRVVDLTGMRYEYIWEHQKGVDRS